MQWDLGPAGLGLLLAMSLWFCLVAWVVAGRSTTRWLPLVATATFFVAGLLTSEVWFGWATQEDLQPNVDGLSFDEVVLVGLLAGLVSVVGTRYLAKRHGVTVAPTRHRDMSAHPR